MKRIAYTNVVFMVLMTLITSAHAITISAERFFTEFAYPAPPGITTCPGLSFSTQDTGLQLSANFTFTQGTTTLSGCDGVTIGNANLISQCPSLYQATTTYCIKQDGLNKLSNLINAGVSATCIQINIAGGVQASQVNCTAVGNCSYTGTTVGFTPLANGVFC